MTNTVGSQVSTSGLFDWQDAWKHAIQKAKAMPDPWAEFHLEDIKTESCTRHRYRQLPRSLGVTPSVSPDTTPVWCLECHRRKNTCAVNLETSRAWTVDCGKQFILTVYNPFHCLIEQMEPFFFCLTLSAGHKSVLTLSADVSWKGSGRARREKVGIPLLCVGLLHNMAGALGGAVRSCDFAPLLPHGVLILTNM